MVRLTECELIRHGIDYPDYFSGCSVHGTRFTFVMTEIGNTELEALLNLEDLLLDCVNFTEEPHIAALMLERYSDIVKSKPIEPKEKEWEEYPAKYYLSLLFNLEITC